MAAGAPARKPETALNIIEILLHCSLQMGINSEAEKIGAREADYLLRARAALPEDPGLSSSTTQWLTAN